MERLFVDTSAWFAHVNREDPDHEAVAELLSEFPGRLVTSDYVFDETVTLCQTRLGHEVAAMTGETLRDPEVVDLIRLSSGDEGAAWQLFLARPDKGYSFTDCTSFVLMRRARLNRAAALDRHFIQEGFEASP